MIQTPRCCAQCKYFRPSINAQAQPNECRRYPPKTTVMFLGMAPNGKPNFYKDVSYGVTLPEWDCGEFGPRLAVAHDLSQIVGVAGTG